MPVVKQQTEDAKTLQDHARQLKAIHKVNNDTSDDVKILKRGYGQFNVVHKQFARLEQETQVTVAQLEALCRTSEMQIESLKYDIERAKKKNDVDQGQFNNIFESIRTTNREI